MKLQHILTGLVFTLSCGECSDIKTGTHDTGPAEPDGQFECRPRDPCTLQDGEEGVCVLLECNSDPVCRSQEDHQCSAAPPFTVCSCTGVITEVSAGCPGPFGWASENLTPSDWTTSRYECDPDLKPPLSFDVKWNFSSVGTADENAFFYPKNSGRIAIRGDANTVEFTEGISPSDTLSFHILVDVDDDQRCSDTDRVYRGFSNEQEAKIDLQNFKLELTDTPTELTEFQCEFF